jgi:hypothetical protein
VAVGIPETYTDCQSFEGLFDVHSADDDKDWYVCFHGTMVQDSSDGISEEDIQLISEVLTPKVIFDIVKEVLLAVE